MAVMLCLAAALSAQTNPQSEQIRQRMAEIRRTTNWDDPAAAAKANAEIKKLAVQLGGGQPAVSFGSGQVQKESSSKPAVISVGASEVTSANITAIATRYYNRSYKTLNAVVKSQFDQHLKEASGKNFSWQSVQKLASMGGMLITLGDDHNLACVYLASAVRAMPDDTLSINNFGAYLRVIDSIRTSITVLLYANRLYGQSPIILTQLGCSYTELNNNKEGEYYLKEALKYDPGFGQAHTALCELYIKQNRLEEALLELFAGVKGMGASYASASGNYAYLQQQAQKAGDNGNKSAKEAFWDQTRKQMSPDALAPLVPTVDRLEMPTFATYPKAFDWMEGGGYGAAVQALSKLTGSMRKFADEFEQAHNDLPDLPPNAVLRDYPNERFALDCITEYFFRESEEEADLFANSFDQIMGEVNEETEFYIQNLERYAKEAVSCYEACGSDQYCAEECKRVFCTHECPAAKIYNAQLQSHWEDYLDVFQETADNQKKILDDLYDFSAQWFSQIYSPYWSKIYAYEIQRVAMTIIGNTYATYAIAFPFPAHNDCGTDCSAFANPYPHPPPEVNRNKPASASSCPPDKKAVVSLLVCSFSFDCESAEFGCSAGVAFSVKRNYVNKSTTSFVGVGVEGNVGFGRGEANAGFTLTKHDNGEMDIGVKGELTGTFGPAVVSGGKNYEFSATVMEGPKFESKDVIVIGLKP